MGFLRSCFYGGKTGLSGYLGVSNKLTVNQGKTQVLESMVPQKRCKLKDNPPMLAVLDETNSVKNIQNESHIRLLGINLSQNLNWTSHLIPGEKSLFSQLRQKLGALNLLEKELPRTGSSICYQYGMGCPETGSGSCNH